MSGTRAKDQISEATILLVPSPPPSTMVSGVLSGMEGPRDQGLSFSFITRS